MLDVQGPRYRCCDGAHPARLPPGRRSWASAGLTLADHLRLKAAAAEAGKPSNDTAVILFWLGGGASHIDMYDLKPDAPAEFRGEFRPIATNVPGIAHRRAPAAAGAAHGQDVRRPQR